MSNDCNKICLNGCIKSYNNTNNTVFCNINANDKYNVAIVFINGLGGTLTSPAYLSHLNDFCTANKISLFIPQFDSHPSFQTKKIDEDIRNLCELFTSDIFVDNKKTNDIFVDNKKMNDNFYKYKEIFLLGHSTGCQVSLLFIKTLSDFILNNTISKLESNLKQSKLGSKLITEENKQLYGELYNNIKGVILQAPVSDVEGMEIVEKELPEYIKIAKEIINNDKNNIINNDKNNIINNDKNNIINNDNNLNNSVKKKEVIFYDNSYYCPYRFLSLYERNNTEDLFSSWINDNEYIKYNNIKHNCNNIKYDNNCNNIKYDNNCNDIKILSVVSGKDKYCYVDVKHKLKLMGEVKEIEGASHSLKEEEHQKEFIKIVEYFITQ
ncbi:hypothetical protein EHP00_1966 [Ecytonucleospora hepatopenaei]|uniref:Uncharacterized protein n=1 Tax=Ecytonucleospora hepatopenaei TaxID=646526 RepID=A0A1W0E2A4_9MICR|nr:hypothetical protein EHP00_1966 [Ecytonucleospora hepatopenaei]